MLPAQDVGLGNHSALRDIIPHRANRVCRLCRSEAASGAASDSIEHQPGQQQLRVPAARPADLGFWVQNARAPGGSWGRAPWA